MASWSKSFVLSATLLAISLVAAACFVSVDETDKEDTATTNPDYPPPGEEYVCDPVSESVQSIYVATKGARELRCIKRGSTTWLTGCKEGQCYDVPINVHYMLTENIGSDVSVVVEAFDNASFAGNPRAMVILPRFDATKPGTYQSSKLILGQGMYYLRAYVRQGNDAILPFEYGGMTLVSDRPVGIYGAASSPTMITVSGATSGVTHTIYLDKLFRREGAEEGTRAHIRMTLKSSNLKFDHGRTVYVQLFSGKDFSYEPEYQFEISTENFLVSGRDGTAEFVTPELRLGTYYLRVYYDHSGNQYLDEGETFAVYMTQGDLASVQTSFKRTEQIQLELRGNEAAP